MADHRATFLRVVAGICATIAQEISSISRPGAAHIHAHGRAKISRTAATHGRPSRRNNCANSGHRPLTIGATDCTLNSHASATIHAIMRATSTAKRGKLAAIARAHDPNHGSDTTVGERWRIRIPSPDGAAEV
ncbi:Serine/threonine protein phosphatase 4 regulatory subunit [Dorcoceras hygrometricum]|uniref:Serine/threonine protein phosphatase 4 regulatory subunit n=1 Tax=Dorcoceras hygrometricum TaxID=472368 RepID=A0A2Z7ALJ7_9LAMI|nr:Serine/threonine protein phosphatase 4 regulatory subunit [Dorcoceras hygrometricum]